MYLYRFPLFLSYSLPLSFSAHLSFYLSLTLRSFTLSYNIRTKAYHQFLRVVKFVFVDGTFYLKITIKLNIIDGKREAICNCLVHWFTVCTKARQIELLFRSDTWLTERFFIISPLLGLGIVFIAIGSNACTHANGREATKS